MKFSEEEQRQIYYARLVCSCFSILGSLFIIIVYFSLPLCRKEQSFRLILYLSISDLMFSSAMLFGPEAEDIPTLCYFQAVVISLFGLSTVLWTAMISTKAYADARGHRRGRGTTRVLTEWQMCSLCFGLSAILAALPFTTDSYGEKIEWCWITAEKGKAAAIAWQLVQFYGPLWIVFAVNLYCVVGVWRMKKADLSEFDNPQEVIDEEMRKHRALLWYPGVLFVCWIVGTIDQIYSYTDPSSTDTDFWLAVLHFSLGSLQGFGNAFVYGFNDEVKGELGKVWSDWRRKPEKTVEKQLLETNESSN